MMAQSGMNGEIQRAVGAAFGCSVSIQKFRHFSERAPSTTWSVRSSPPSVRRAERRTTPWEPEFKDQSEQPSANCDVIEGLDFAHRTLPQEDHHTQVGNTNEMPDLKLDAQPEAGTPSLGSTDPSLA